MTDTILITDMPWVRYLERRIRRGIQYVMLLYFLQFLLPSYIYRMYRYSEEEMAFSDYFQSISPWFEFFALFPGVFVMLAARFIVVPFAFALVALVWVGWDSLSGDEKRFSAFTSLISIVAIPLTTPLFDGFVTWFIAMD
jgi:hypothetical protein